MATTFRKRWLGESGQVLVAEVVHRLARRLPLDALELGTTDGGLVDLRGLTLPSPRVTGRREFEGMFFEARDGMVKLHGAVLEGLDLSGAVLDFMWLHESVVRQCRLDGARWQEGRNWACRFEDCTLRRADLRGFAAAPEYKGVRTVFRSVDFSDADLRSFTCTGAIFEDCSFEGAKLDRVDFGGSIFRRVRFAGRLNEVAFYDVPWEHEDFEPNVMEDVDFSEAELYMVDFRKLALDQVRWPQHPANYVFSEFPCVAKRVTAALVNDGRPDALGAAAIFEHQLEWMHPARRTGLVHRDELEPLADHVIELIREAEQSCQSRRV